MTETVIRLEPNKFIHIHDNNTNATTLLRGPATVTLQSNQSATIKPQPLHIIFPRNYSVIENPVVRDEEGNVVTSANGQAKNRIGELELRFCQPPFALYPLETIVVNNAVLPVLNSNQALLLRAVREFKHVYEGETVARKAGDEFLFFGPGTYTPRVEVEIVETRDAVVVNFNESLKLRARNKFTDVTGTVRQVGEEYLWSKPGSYIIGVDEQLVTVVPAKIITKDIALHVEVKKSFYDNRPFAKKDRLPGEVYLVDSTMTAEFTPQPQEDVIKTVKLITVSNRQFAVVMDPVGANGKPQLGRRKVVTNTSFFLQPGERLDSYGIKDAYVLGEDEAVLVRAVEEFEDTQLSPPIRRVSGEQWLLRGPREYIPNEYVRIVPDAVGSEIRRKIVLGAGEGVYVRDTLNGSVRVIAGQAYMLEAYEELWEKQLPTIVEDKLSRQLGSHAAYMDRNSAAGAKRDKTKLVRYHIPHNSVTQVFDYKLRTRRTIFGPDLVSLGPDEEFTVLSLSGSEWDPKRPEVCLPKETDKIKALYLFLGPSNLADVVNVETRDHARLSLQLSYDWKFDVEQGNIAEADQCFNVPDFVGDCCSCIASRVRASIAAVSFEHFHKNSARLLQIAVFGVDSEGNPKKELRFPSNRLLVSSVDIQAIEVVDEKTREALKQSVKMAIEITTQGQEATARQEASIREQTARGKLERQQIQDKSLSEVERKKLIEVQTACNSISTTGQAKAEARARALAANIDGDLNVQLAHIKAKKSDLMDVAQLEIKLAKTGQELSYQSAKNELDVQFQDEQAKLESGKFGRVMEAVGKQTVQEMARAGPEMQAKILGALGLQGYLVTDGTNPINLFNTAKGMTAAATNGRPATA